VTISLISFADPSDPTTASVSTNEPVIDESPAGVVDQDGMPTRMSTPPLSAAV